MLINQFYLGEIEASCSWIVVWEDDWPDYWLAAVSFDFAKMKFGEEGEFGSTLEVGTHHVELDDQMDDCMDTHLKFEYYINWKKLCFCVWLTDESLSFKL